MDEVLYLMQGISPYKMYLLLMMYRTGSASEIQEHNNGRERLELTCESELNEGQDVVMTVVVDNQSANDIANKEDYTNSRLNTSVVSSSDGQQNGKTFSSTFGLTEEENREFWNMLLPTETGSGRFTIT